VPVNDQYQVTVTKENYSEVSRQVGVDQSQKTVGFTVNRSPRVTISPSQDRVVTGESVEVRITNEYDNPIGNVSVSLDGDSVGTTDAQGRLSFVVENQGEHTISATHNGNSAEYTIQGVQAATSPAETDTATETDSEDGDDGGSSTFGPGFGPVAVVLALLALTLLARRRD
jgi:PGF-CTERM protein